MPGTWTIRGPPSLPFAGRKVLAPASGRSRAFGTLSVLLSQVTKHSSLDSTPRNGDETFLQAATRPLAHYQASELEQVFLSSIPGPSGMMSRPPSGIRSSKGLASTNPKQGTVPSLAAGQSCRDGFRSGHQT